MSHRMGGRWSGQPDSSRDSTEARSNRKPSTCMSADPVPQAVEDQAAHHRVVRVQRVAGAGVVRVAGAVRLEDVVRVVVEAAEGEGRPLVVPFRRVVVHDVQDHLDARAVERLDEVPELVDGTERVPARAVAGVRGEERTRGYIPSS